MKFMYCLRLLTGLIFILLFNAHSVAQLKATDTTRSIKMANGETLKRYYFVMLVKGAKRDAIKDTTQINNIQAGHMANMEKLAAAGKLMVAGPFGDDGNWRGIFIFDCATQQEVERLLSTDPAIRSGRLDYEIHPWWTQVGATFK